MRWIGVFFMFLAARPLYAESPWDLESPFPKTALIEIKNGKKEEREIQSAKLTGDKVEFVYPDGKLGLFPTSEVRAILPCLPKAGQDASPEEIDRAIRFLEGLPDEFRGRPEASPETLQRWRDLKKPAEEALERKKKAEALVQAKKQKDDQARVSAWLQEVTNFQKARGEEDLAELKRTGELFLKEKIGDEGKVRDGLFMISQVSSKEKGPPLPDLAKLDEIQPTLVPDDLLIWICAGILFLSLFGLLAGLSFTSSGLSRFREGAFLGGLLFGGAGLAILGGLVMIWWPPDQQGSGISADLSPNMQKAVLFAKNRVKPVYFLPETEFEVSPQEFVAGLMATLPPNPERTGIFKGKFSQGKVFSQGSQWFWRQPVTVLALPFPLTFTFSGKTPSHDRWTDCPVEQVQLGRITLPEVFVGTLGESLLSSFHNGLSAGGLDGVKLVDGSNHNLSVRIPSSGTRPKQQDKKATYRREISAEDLGRAFLSGQGGEFVGKFVVLDGFVAKLSSGIEYSKSQMDEKTKDQHDTPKIGSDQYDVFYLTAADHYGFRNDPLYIRCVVKSSLVFSMDSHGDIYTGTTVNHVNEKPFLKKGKRIQFLKEGRVENPEIKNNEIEVYGIEVEGEADIKSIDPNSPAQP